MRLSQSLGGCSGLSVCVRVRVCDVWLWCGVRCVALVNVFVFVWCGVSVGCGWIAAAAARAERRTEG